MIERRIGRIGRDAQQRMRLAQLLVGQAGAFGAEHHRHRRMLGLGHERAAPPRARRARENTGRVRGWWSPAPARSPQAPRPDRPRRARAPADPRRRRRGRWPRDAETASAAPAPAPRAAMFLSARAAAPILPGCEVSTRTMRIGRGTTCYPNRLSFAIVRHASIAQYRRARRAPRRRGHRPQPGTAREPGGHLQGPQRLRQRNRSQPPSARSSTSSTSTIPSMPSSPRRAAAAASIDTVWIIDPLDGTTNFLHGFPVFAVSIAVQQRGRLEIGVIYDPMRQEVFTAARGAGAHLENRRIRVSKQRTLEGALLATGFPYRERRARRRRLFRHAPHAVAHDRRHAPPGLGGARSGLCRRRPRRWLLGDRTQALGHGRRHADDPGGRRTRRHAQRRGVPAWGKHRRRCAKSVRGADRGAWRRMYRTSCADV